ncbi:hypothetical protein RCZAHN_79 [Rhodobacter phage RcZahn]|nr:hypothetical protein RCZAHN_79 [Rhodobacter phage RcZahn]
MPNEGLMELANSARDHYRHSLDQDVRPPAFILARTKAGQVAHVPLPYTDPQTKAKMLHMARITFGFWQVVEYVVAYESWMVRREFPRGTADLTALANTIRPSEEPDRQDSFVIAGAGRAGTVFGVASIVTDGMVRAVGEMKWIDGAEALVDGTMFHLLPPESLPAPPEGLKRAFFEQFPSLDLNRRVWESSETPKEGA